MSTEIDYQNNPLHGVSLKDLVTQIVEHYGYELLYAYLNIQCFGRNPSIDASVKFLKKTDWAREKVESFYLYQFKSLPRASAAEFEKPPRDRIVPRDQVPGRPAVLSLEDAERLREKRARKAAERDARGGERGSYAPRSSQAPRAPQPGRAAPAATQDDPWAKWKK